MYSRYKPKTNPDPDKICNTICWSRTYYRKCVGYCQLKGKYLTAKQLKMKKCLSKVCRHLVKIEDREYWRERGKKKLKKAGD